MKVLEVQNVTKYYEHVVAVKEVSFAVESGRIFGLLGPNGAGKTTTIRMITYIILPDEGQVFFKGRPVGPWSQELMGYLPEERGLYRKMRVGEQLEYFAMLKGLSRRQAKEKVRYWLKRFDAESWYSRKTEELSKGMQQKVQFIATIVHDPELLIFDEPFSGLDPINAELLQEIIMELKAAGRTILFASHRMEQVEQLCDDICLISSGRVVLSGSLRAIKKAYGRNHIVVEFEGEDTFVDALEKMGWVKVELRNQHRVELKLLDTIKPAEVLRFILDHVDDVYRFEVTEPPLNEIFVRAVQGNIPVIQE